MTNLQEFPIAGKYGRYGGKYIPETLIPAINELEDAYVKIRNNPKFRGNSITTFKIMLEDLHRFILPKI